MRKTLLQIILLACTLTANAQIAKYDLNGDGKVNDADVTELVNYILTASSYKSCPDNNHPHWIDLGLPSGTKWRCCNEGASTPEGYGGYYEYGQVASAPSWDQITELLDHTTYVWTTQNGVNGGKFTGRNGGTIFLPAAGFRWFGEFLDVGSLGRYWSSTYYVEDCAYVLGFGSDDAYWSDLYSSRGLSVRPVRSLIAKYDLNGDGKVNVADVTELVTHSNDGYKSCPDNNHPHWIDLGLPSGTKWRCCNEGASTPEGYGGYYEYGQVASAPSWDQITELLDHTTYVWTTQNGVNGGKFTGSNGGTIFLPAAGCRWDGWFDSVGSYGYYWSSTSYDEGYACELDFGSSDALWGYDGRNYEHSVRPVR